MPKLIPKLTYKLPVAIVVKLHSALQEISSRHSTITPEEVEELNESVLSSMEKGEGGEW